MKKRIAAGIILLFIGINLYEWYISTYHLKNTYYQIEGEELSKTIRIVQLSDLHNRTFGTKNKKLLSMVKRQHPDLIFVTGDLINSDDPNLEIGIQLLQDLKRIAPVYISYGNHEKEYEERYENNLSDKLEQTGAEVLESEYQDIVVRDQKIRIGGIYGYCIPKKSLKTVEADDQEGRFLFKMQDTDRYTILLCHMPVCWITKGLDAWEICCVFAGHSHGGQIVLPFFGALYAPDQGWFPGKVKGLFSSKKGTKSLVVSGGLGTSGRRPRWNNIPEIVTVDIKPEEK